MSWLRLPAPSDLPSSERTTFYDLARFLERSTALEPPSLPLAGSTLDAASRVLTDLYRQGWGIRVCDGDQLEIRPPLQSGVAEDEKLRVRDQELLKRDEQLSQPSVKRFIKKMETPRERNGRFVSIFNLMRDGQELSQTLASLQPDHAPSEAARSAIDPYVQIVEPNERDRQTGLKLMDVWRYFRHTWSNQYTTVPGRSMLILIRDRAVHDEPIIGIAALSSAIVQLDERDHWIGWRPQDVLDELTARPSAELARWVVERLERRKEEIYVGDLLRDELFWPEMWKNPTPKAVDNLRAEAKARRVDHQRLAGRSLQGRLDRQDATYWRQRAETDLFRSKRCLLLADLLRDKSALLPYLYPTPDVHGLSTAMKDHRARQSVRSVARRAKSDSVGTEIADLSVCGAVAPYRDVIGGKLVTMLAMSPTVVRAYHRKYHAYESEIASSMAGRAVSRASHLVFIGTTSLYGTTSSQYNRVSIPASILEARCELRLERLGRSRSFGTSHLSAPTVRSLVRLSEQHKNGARVNSVFGEGGNPKLRKVRGGLDALGWPSEQLLQHGRKRIIYGVSLVSNLRNYLLGMEDQPNYQMELDLDDDVGRISAWWMDRWMMGRAQSLDVLARISLNTLDRPVTHGARVQMPDTSDS